jgi:hypothetical protein
MNSNILSLSRLLQLCALAVCTQKDCLFALFRKQIKKFNEILALLHVNIIKNEARGKNLQSSLLRGERTLLLTLLQEGENFSH